MKVIYQISRLDQNILENKKFKINNEIYESPLSGFALKQYLKVLYKNDAVKLILIYPISLALNSRMLSVKDEKLKDFIKDIRLILEKEENYNNFLKNPKEVFKNHPYNDKNFADDFLIIHSTGCYENRIFSAKFDFIVFEIFCDIVKRYSNEWKNEKNIEIYIDVSTGQNIYTSAILEAVRKFIVYHKLQNWTKNRNLVVKLSYSDPIIGTTASEFQIYFDYVLDIKAFFSSTIKKEDINNFVLARKIVAEDRDLKNKIQESLKNFLILFSAFKNAIPLVLYNFKFDDISNLDSLILSLLNKCYSIFNQDWQNGREISTEDYIKVFYTLSFYKGLLEIMQKENISYTEDGVFLEEVKYKKDLFKNYLDVNINLLGNELAFFERYKSNGRLLSEVIIDNNWHQLREFITGETMDFMPRNFIAHAGFERNVVLIKKENNQLKLKYLHDENLKERIKDALINNV